MICKECGTKFSSGLFCPECGTRIGSIFGFGKDEQTSGQCAGEEYDAKKYGAQGLVGDLYAKEIKIAAGERRAFENKKLIVEKGIYVGENAKVEFRNCSFAINEETTLRAEGADIDFEHCTIEGNGKFLYSSYYGASKKRETLEFRNCVFGDSGLSSAKMYTSHFIELRGGGEDRVYFENCLNRKKCFCEFGNPSSLARERRLEFRNCIIDIDNMKTISVMEDMFVAGENLIVEFNNCNIKSLQKLIDSRPWEESYNKAKLVIKNSYFDCYDPRCN